MGNNNGKKNKCTTDESSNPQPPEGMPNPIDFDLQDMEAPDDVFLPTRNRQQIAFISPHCLNYLIIIYSK